MHVLSLTITKGNISQSFEGCRQTFEGYKIAFVMHYNKINAKANIIQFMHVAIARSKIHPL